MHMWGDNWEHWDDLYKAEHFIADYVYKHSRCRLMSKEKYGTIRYEWIFPPKGGCCVQKWTCVRIPLLSKKYNKETKKYEYVFNRTKLLRGWPVWRWCDSWLYRKWEEYGWRTLDKAIVLACRQWPQCREEILDDWIFRKY